MQMLGGDPDRTNAAQPPITTHRNNNRENKAACIASHKSAAGTLKWRVGRASTLAALTCRVEESRP